MQGNKSCWAIFALLCCSLLSASVRAAGPVSGQILGGSTDAPIRIEVFSDFECPSCRELYLDVMRRVLADYSSKNKVCVIYHEYPLSIHRYSRDAARYAEAASQLGREKLLRVYDAFFMDQAKWSQDGNLEASLAKVLSRGDIQMLKDVMRDPGINAAVEKEIGLGMQKGIRSTPTFFVYARGKEQKVEGRLTYVAMQQFIDATLR